MTEAKHGETPLSGDLCRRDARECIEMETERDALRVELERLREEVTAGEDLIRALNNTEELYQQALHDLEAARGERDGAYEVLKELTDQCEAEFTLDGTWINDGQLVRHSTYQKALTVLLKSQPTPQPTMQDYSIAALGIAEPQKKPTPQAENEK